MSRDLSSTIGDLVRRSAARHPARTAIVFGQRRWSYAELDAAVDAVALRLRSRGLAMGDRVAALGRNSDAYAILFLACARAGLVHVPLNYNATGPELEYLVRQSGSAALFADPAYRDAAARVAAEVGVERCGSLRDGADEEWDVLAWGSSGAGERFEAEVDDTDLVQLLYTSGTTSAPKGAMLTHRALIHHYLSCIVALDLREHDRPLHALPLYHSAQMHIFLVPYLAVGATSEIVEAPVVEDLLRRIEEDAIGSLFAPPTVWIGVTQSDAFRRRDLSALRKLFYGASIMPLPILERLREALPGVGFYNLFGQSEIGPLATVLRPEEHDVRPDSAGRPVLFVEVRVVDEELRDVAPGEIGEAVYRSPQLCLGYWDKPEETEAAFAGGWFHSGDLVRRDEEGYLWVVDRTKDVINTGGVVVASREVEDALFRHPAVADVAVIATPHERWIEAITAIVVPNGDVTAAELQDHARRQLAAHKVPKLVHFVDELPRNPSGKVLKRELRTRFAGDGGAVSRPR